MLCAAWLYAGPLNPPTGPIASTYKTLTDVEPRVAISATNTPGDADSLFRINQPGSYYLTANITGVAGKHGIEIAASGVTLDLNGFEMTGVRTADVFFDGVRVDAAGYKNISVRNGTLQDWSSDGIDFVSFSPTNCLVTDVRTYSNSERGIAVGENSLVTSCTSSFNSSDGIALSFTCVASNCVVSNNGRDGINGSVNNTVSHCTANANGIDGIGAGINSQVTACVSYDNTENGFSIGSGASIMACSCHANGANGIELFYGSVAKDCVTQINTLHGITAFDRCHISGNTCVRNGSAAGIGSGIYVNGNDGRIEGNTCIEADRGIEVDGTGNFIVKNTCAGNTVANWDIAANNVCGPILNRSAPVSAAILGDSAPSSLGTTDANANFTH